MGLWTDIEDGSVQQLSDRSKIFIRVGRVRERVRRCKPVLSLSKGERRLHEDISKTIMTDYLECNWENRDENTIEG